MWSSPDPPQGQDNNTDNRKSRVQTAPCRRGHHFSKKHASYGADSCAWAPSTVEFCVIAPLKFESPSHCQLPVEQSVSWKLHHLRSLFFQMFCTDFDELLCSAHELGAFTWGTKPHWYVHGLKLQLVLIETNFSTISSPEKASKREIWEILEYGGTLSTQSRGHLRSRLQLEVISGKRTEHQVCIANWK